MKPLLALGALILTATPAIAESPHRVTIVYADSVSSRDAAITRCGRFVGLDERCVAVSLSEPVQGYSVTVEWRYVEPMPTFNWLNK